MKEIYYLLKRNMLLYIRDYVSVFFSVLSMLIVLALMVVFLGSMNSENVVSALAVSGGVRDTAADTHGHDGAGRSEKQAGVFLHGSGQAYSDCAWLYSCSMDCRNGHVCTDTGIG